MKRFNRQIADELLRLHEESPGDVLKPKTVVDAARPPRSILHPHFKWNNRVAAELYRLEQARELIRTTVIITGKIVHPVFVSLRMDRDEPGGGYRVTTRVLNNREQREELLAEAFADLKAFEARYRMLKELAKVFKAAREVMRRQRK